ncbi:MAG: hypothetical protein J6V50_05175 [Clostridia bacterium]|nr:hypothetical protein [Clostridia bacterium]
MKKITALLLSSVLLLTAVFVAIPLSAVAADTTPAPIEAKPFVIDSVTNGDSTALTIADGAPLSFTSVKGKRITLNSGKDFYYVDGDGRGKYSASFTPTAGTTVTSDETHFMFRFEANGPSSFCFRIDWADSWLYLNSEATIEVLKDGATQWETKTVTAGTRPQIEFDEAFSGYIKFSYLSNSILPSSESQIINIHLYTYGMGTVGENTYADEMTVGPFFTVTSNSASTVINVPDEFKPQPIEAVPFEFSYNSTWTGGNMSGVSTTPLSFTTAKGIKWILNSGKAFENAGAIMANPVGARFQLPSAYIIPANEEQYMFYVETNGKTSLFPRFYSYDYSQYFLKNNCTVQILEIGADSWKDLATVESGDTQGTNFGGYAIELTKAFKGYIKIAYEDIGNDNEGYINSNTGKNYGLRAIDLFVKGMGTVGGNTYADEMTVGPFFTVTSDSASTKINVPENYQTMPVEAKPLVLDNSSANALATNVTVADSKSLSSALENGKTFTLNSGKDFYGVRDNGRGSAGFTFNMNAGTTVNQGETHLMFHFKANGPAVFNPLFVSNNYWYYLKSSTTVEVLEDGDTNWKTIQTSGVVNPSDPWSQIEFNEAFSGLIKIAYSDLGLSFSDAITSYPVNKIDFYIYGMGEGDGYSYATEMSVGTFYSVSSDSISTEIDVDTVDGDVNADGAINSNDIYVVRNYMLRGIESKYLDEYGNLSDADTEIDILDLVKLAALAQ